MWRGRKNLFIVTNRAGKVTEKLGAGQRLAAYGLTHRMQDSKNSLLKGLAATQ